MQENLPYLLGLLQLGEATEREIDLLKTMIDQRVDAGMLDLDSHKHITEYIAKLEAEQDDTTDD